jgi:hypothetical protein
MTKIKNYELDSTINDDDKVIGTDGLPGPNFGRTKNYSIGSLVTYIEDQLDPVDGSGTLNTIPIWTPDGDTLGDSILTYSPLNTAITIGGKLIVASTLNVGENTTTGSLTLQGYLADASDSYGTANQILTSTGTQTSWQDFSTLVPNNITGSGTLNTISMFTPDGTAIGDSVIVQNAAGTRIDINSTLAVNGNTGITGNLDLTGVATFENDISVGEGLKDASDSYGTANQILTSTGTQTSWQDFSALVPNNITGTGTLNAIPIFTPDGQKIGDSIVTQGALGQGVNVAGGLTVAGTTQLNGTITVEEVATFNDEVDCTNNVTVQGILQADGNTVLGDSTADTTTINSTLSILSVVKDSNNTLGTDGQVLVANAASELLWQDQDGDTTYTYTSSQDGTSVDLILTDGTSSSTVTLTAGNSITLTDNGNNEVAIAATGGAANTTYFLDSIKSNNSTVIRLNGSDATTTSYQFTAGTGVTFNQAGTGTVIDFDISGSGAVGGSGTLNTVPLWTPDGNTLGDSSLTVDADGGVKIDTLAYGTSNITPELTLYGNKASLILESAGYGDAFIFFKPNPTSGSLGVFDIEDPVPATPSAKFVWTKNTSLNEYMRLDTVTGNLGVGTTNPSHRVTVEGQSAFKASDQGIVYFNINKDNSSGETFIGTGILNSTLYVGAPTPMSTQNLEVLGTGKFRDGIKDTSDSVGTSGQILTSTGSQVQWVDLSGLIPNNVTGSGTENSGVLWGAGGTVLTDSLLKHGTGVNSVGIGLNNDTQGLESIAFTRSTSKADYSFALGYESVTDGEFSVTLGKGTYTAGRHAMAANYKSLALGQSSFAGGHTSATGGDGAVALGHNASAGNFGAAKLVATFPNDQTTFDIEGIVGTVEAGLFMRYGENLDVPDPRIEVLTFTDNGNNSATLTVAAPGIRPIQGELVVFEEATPFRGDHQGGVALGNDAYSLGEGTVSIGHTSVAEADKAVALGDAARSSGESSVAIGKNATVTSADTIALGGDSTKILMNALAASSSYADDTAAAAGGVDIGELYRNGNIVQIRLT